MGLTSAEIPSYWTRRAQQYTEKGNWGPGAATPEQHVEQVAVRADFIFSTCPRNLRTVDYGCGIGRYAQYFPPSQYRGLDISTPYLDIARKENPEHRFLQLGSPSWTEAWDWDFELFFTATVLQHCSDTVIDGLLASLAAKKRDKFTLSLYEYANPKWISRQTIGRPAHEYTAMVAKHFQVLGSGTQSHMIHAACHAHTMIDVGPQESG